MRVSGFPAVGVAALSLAIGFGLGTTTGASQSAEEAGVALAVGSFDSVAVDVAAAPVAKPATRETGPSPTPSKSSPDPVVRVHINAEPWATIAVDGQEAGVTPLGNVQLVAGLHHFRATMPDGQVMERAIRVTPTQRHVAFP